MSLMRMNAMVYNTHRVNDDQKQNSYNAVPARPLSTRILQMRMFASNMATCSCRHINAACCYAHAMQFPEG